MSDKTGIEWTDATWNPVRGCTEISPGCAHCYAALVAARFSGPGQPYEGLAYFDADGKAHWTGVLREVPDHLYDPLRWRRPRMIFVNSMSDLFHPGVSDGYIARVWQVMAECPQHTFQILTKRPKRMADWVARWADTAGDGDPLMARGPAAVRAAHTSGRALLFADMLESMLDGDDEPPPGAAWPTYDWMEGPRWLPPVLPNVWLGTSIEGLTTAMIRWPDLARTPAAVRFVSLEPLLGDLGPLPLSSDSAGRVDWVIVGGESGPRARPMEAAWVRSIRDQCVRKGVPFFFKQWGGVNKKAAGRELDGREWNEMPARHTEAIPV